MVPPELGDFLLDQYNDLKIGFTHQKHNGRNFDGHVVLEKVHFFTSCSSLLGSQYGVLWRVKVALISDPTTDLFQICSWALRWLAAVLGPTTRLLVLLRPTES